MYTDFATFIDVLYNLNLIDKIEAKHIIERFLAQNGLLTPEEVKTLKEVQESLDKQKAESEKLAEGT